TLGEMRQRPLRACAALTLGRLQGGWVRDDEGCIDPRALVPDPEFRAFTWPTPSVNPWADVYLAVDRDMAPVKIKGRTGRGRVVPMLLDGEARARICGRLATAAWLAAGAPRARAILPPPRTDFNTELRRVLARESAT